MRLSATVPFVVAVLPVVSALFAALPAAAQKVVAPREPTAEELAALRTGLVEMNRLDQLHRVAVSWGTTDREELARLQALDDDAHLKEATRRWRAGIRLPKKVEAELMARQRVLDKANFDRLIGWVRTFGYPDPKRLGIDAPDPVAVLIHADNDWYDAVTDLLRREVIGKRMGAKQFAAVTDRKAQHAGRVQLYGTCRRFDPKRDEVLPPEIEDIDATNRARAAIGLPPLKEYVVVARDAGRKE